MQSPTDKADAYRALRLARRQSRRLKRAALWLLVLDALGTIALLLWFNWRQFL